MKDSHESNNAGSGPSSVPLSPYQLVALSLLLVAGLLRAQESRPTPEIAKAEELIHDVFKEEYAKAKTDRATRKLLAVTLLKQARQIHEEAAVRFVALREARDLAAQASDPATAFTAITELARDRPVDVLAMKNNVLTIAAAHLPTGDDAASRSEAASLAEAALSVSQSAADAEDFDRAVQLGILAEKVARKARATTLLAALGKRIPQLRMLQQATARVRPFLEKLKSDPRDAEANREVGRYWALFRGNWLKGLPFLARGADAGLSGLARKDLTQPRDPGPQAALGEGWWKRAQDEKGTARVQMLARSFRWYQQAVFQLDGAARQQAERRLEVLRKTVPPELRVTDIATLVRKLEGHSAEVLGCALSASGRHALSASADKTVRLWDTATGQELRRFLGHTAPVYGVALSPDGKLAASCGEDRTIRLWNLLSGKERLRLEGHSETVNNVAFSPDGKYLASASDDRTLRLWNVATGKEVRRFEGHAQGVYCVAFSPDGRLLASGSSDQTLRLWEVNAGKEVRRFEGHTGQVLAVAFVPGGRRLLSSGEDQTIRLWDTDTGKEVRRYLGHTASVGGLAVTPDGLRFLSCSDDTTLRLWELETGKELRQLHGHTAAVYRVVLSADGRLALSCSLDKTLRLWGGPR
jgi:hypothetical protein